VIISGNDVVEKAREYIGTPFQHQGRVKGLACDCVGLPLMVAGELSLKDKHGTPLTGSTYCTYGMQPIGNYVHDVCAQHLVYVPIRLMAPGDILTLNVVTAACHVAIVSNIDGIFHIIHAYNGGPGCVVEHVLDDKWRRRIAGCFRFPEVVN
jgi:NlpC/P60 family putative phage cell wall peptidase